MGKYTKQRALIAGLVLSLIVNSILLCLLYFRSQNILWVEFRRFATIVGYTHMGVESNNKDNLIQLLGQYQNNTPFLEVKSIKAGYMTEQVIKEYEYILKTLAYKDNYEPEQILKILLEVGGILNNLVGNRGRWMRYQGAELSNKEIEDVMQMIAPMLGELEEKIGLHNNLSK